MSREKSNGRFFENYAFYLIENELNRNRLGLLPEACSMYQSKGYHSSARKKDIVVDISIEVYTANSKKWSLLWIWECKDYKTRSIPVDDVEEFWAKLQQIGGTNVKGGIITSGTFQSGALNFAESSGIAVIRIMPDHKLNWIQRSANMIEVPGHRRFENELSKRIFLDNNFVSSSSPMFLDVSGKIYDNLSGLFRGIS